MSETIDLLSTSRASQLIIQRLGPRPSAIQAVVSLSVRRGLPDFKLFPEFCMGDAVLSVRGVGSGG